MHPRFLLPAVFVFAMGANAQNPDAPDQKKIISYQRDLEYFNASELEQSIVCLSGTLIDKESEPTVLRVSVLLKEGIYTKVAVKNYDYVRMIPNASIKRVSKFKCVSTTCKIDHNGVQGDDAHVGLLEFEAEVDLNPAVTGQSNNMLVGVVSLPVSSKLTSIVCKRKFVVFVDEMVHVKNEGSSQRDAE